MKRRSSERVKSSAAAAATAAAADDEVPAKPAPPKKLKTPSKPAAKSAKSPKKTTPKRSPKAKATKATKTTKGKGTSDASAGAGAGSEPEESSPVTPLARSSTAMSVGDLDDEPGTPGLEPSPSVEAALRQPHHFPSKDDKLGWKIAAWNVNGLRALLKKDKKALASYFENEDLDVLVLNETKIDDAITDTFSDVVPDTHIYWNCSVKKGYAGTAIISRHKPISVTKGIDVEEHDNEGRILTAEFPDFHVVVTYVPNSGMKLDRLSYRTTSFDPAMLEFIKSLEEKKPVIWLGDFNVAHLDIDIHEPKRNRNKSPGFCDAERENFTKVLGSGLVDVWRERNPDVAHYTYWSYRRNLKARNKGWRLDYVLCSKSLVEHVKSTFIRAAVEGSDHVPVGIDIEMPEKK